MEENKKEESEINDKNKRNKEIIFLIVLGIVIIGITIGFAVYRLVDYDKTRYSFPSSSGGFSIDKPIIYIYPEKEMELTVKLGMKDNITCSYPKYQDGWNVIAYPDGTLIDKENNKKLYALYWEGKREKEIPMNDGFVVKGEDSAKFLEEKLAILGLNEKESEEFIIYWLPKLESNKYNLIRFETVEEIEQNMPLEISQEPDTLIRVWMQFKGLETSIEIPEQHLETNSRVGLTVVEWGGTEIK